MPALAEQPLVSCIMPTANRRDFVPRAIQYFLRQDYARKELIVVDDGNDRVEDLIPADDRVRYIRLNARAKIGSKRNLACDASRGEIVAHWDDDDWQARHRLSYQVEEMLRAGVEVCGIGDPVFFSPQTRAAWQYRYPQAQRLWLSGSTLCYARAFWASHPFDDIDLGEDARFVWSGHPDRMLRLPDVHFHVGIVHGRNASPKQTDTPYWHPYPIETVRGLLGTDWDWYHNGGRVDRGTVSAPGTTVVGESGAAVCAAKRADLARPEFVAFNHAQSLPPMRRWELPFALFNLDLPNTPAVLDCTINPAGFGERLSRLYPHAVYRHRSPMQQGSFVLPVGVPDEAFDGVVCINTLEHLLAPQREALTAAMARKLKPGGRLVLTSDYYFDTFWEQPRFWQLGVMSADRREIFNGWNKVTPQAWLGLCGRSGLRPLSEPGTLTEPREDDPTLYRHPQPYPHACIGGVFFKPPRLDSSAGRTVVLSLLTWNTRDVSVDSVRALLDEARLLRRLGHRPHLCLCDNGSTDGTADALQRLEGEIDVSYRFIFNPDNLGNAVARNQIIDDALGVGADYLLFMDGDIEVVPFSSVAMLRHLENSGGQLGCVGADSSGQTPLRAHASACFYSIDRVEATTLVAWTQYGLFRRCVFEEGVRFDESQPFRGPGWGFEDNDLVFQMTMKGFANERFFGMTYLHRSARSSIRIMRASGLDPEALFQRRRQHVIEKWSAVPAINNGPLAELRSYSWCY